MASNTKIEWADHTFNPWLGCQKVSAGCDNCYAEAMMDTRLGKVVWGPHGARQRTSVNYWHQPRLWNEKARAAGRRAKVFCASLADVFDNHRSIDPAWRTDLWELIEATPNLTWMLLTKRPQNIATMLPHEWQVSPRWNVWLGTTVENQAEADRRIPALMTSPGGLRFLSCEPLLGAVDLTDWLTPSYSIASRFDPELGRCVDRHSYCAGLDWVICGGESGPNARPMHPDWARSLRDQCTAADVPFLFKQWGEWLPWEPSYAPEWVSQRGAREDRHVLFPADIDSDPRWDDGLGYCLDFDHAAFQKVGKKAAGRDLDGVTWDQVPGATAPADVKSESQ